MLALAASTSICHIFPSKTHSLLIGGYSLAGPRPLCAPSEGTVGAGYVSVPESLPTETESCTS